MHTHAEVAPPSFSGTAVLEPCWSRTMQLSGVQSRHRRFII